MVGRLYGDPDRQTGRQAGRQTSQSLLSPVTADDHLELSHMLSCMKCLVVGNRRCALEW